MLRPQTTAHLAQTMALLELTTLELRQKVEAELARNPALELIEEFRCPTCHKVLTNRTLLILVINSGSLLFISDCFIFKLTFPFTYE
jgi:hypothetical protein